MLQRIFTARQHEYTELLFCIRLEQEDKELQKEAEVCQVRQPTPLPHSRACRATSSSSERCSGTFREPSVSGRAPGMQEARITNLRGKLVVCQCGCLSWNITPPPSSYLWCHMKRRSTEYQHQLNTGNGIVLNQCRNITVRLVKTNILKRIHTPTGKI